MACEIFMFAPEIELFLGRSADGCGRTERFSVGHCKSKLFGQNAGGKNRKIRDAQSLMERFGAAGVQPALRVTRQKLQLPLAPGPEFEESCATELYSDQG